MITAQDIFIMEREMLAELEYRLYQSNLSHEERDQIEDLLHTGITEGQYEELMKRVSDRIITPLDRIRNGETLNASQINHAVFLAAKNE